MQIAPAVWKVREELKKLLRKDKRYVLAVSGGADSIALADAAADLFTNAKENLLVCHVEHGIRGAESLADAKLVQNFCQRRALGYACRHVDAIGYANVNGLTLEEAARKLRYEVLLKQAEKFGAAAIVTAHQADDQAETVLWKLLRGAGTDGLCGMQTVVQQNGLVLLRPLLELSRADIEEYCAAKQLTFCQDSTNTDLHYTRNRIRHELLPYLEEHFNPAVKATLVKEAKLLAEEQQCLAEMTEQCLGDKELWGIESDSNIQGYWLSAVRLLRLPTALRRRILRELYFRLGGKELSYERTQALEGLCLQGVGGKLIQLPGEIEAVYKKKKIYLVRCSNNE